jgi:hypothetical protein
VIAFVFLAAAATAGASAPEQRPPSGTPLVQATATVRIVQGERVTASEVPKIAMVNDTRVRGSDGVERDGRLVEFP